MAQANSDVVALQLEKVHDALKPLFELVGTTLELISDKGGIEKVSSRSMRIPIELVAPGKFRQVDLDGGDLGRGSGTKYDVMTVTPIDFVTALETTKKVAMTTDSSEKAIANAVRRDVKNGVKTLRWGLDTLLQTAGTGQIGVASTVSGTTWTLSNTSFKGNLIRAGQTVNLYDSTFTTKRVGNAVVQTVSTPPTSTVTVDVLPSGGTSGDLIVIEGLTGSNPVSLFGIPYFHASSGTVLGQSRSTYPQLVTPSVSANSNSLAPTQVRLAKNLLRQKFGDSGVPKTMVAHLHPAQEDAYEQIGYSISEFHLDGSGKQSVDTFLRQKSIDGVPIKANIHADMTRIDFMCLEYWGRAVSLDIDFYTDPGNGETMFGVYGTSQGRAAAVLWYLATSLQIYNSAPSVGCFISSLAVPTGY